MVSNIEEIKEKSKPLAQKNDFENYVNQRKFEEEITKIAKSINLKVIQSSELKNEIETITDKKEKFVFFFITFTALRRAKFGDLEEFVEEYKNEFSYPILKHIELLSRNVKSDKDLYKLMNDAFKLATQKKDGYDFTRHEGVLNHFAELTARYYENNLDKRHENDDKSIIKSANRAIDKAINLSNKCVYPKYYLNKGRLLALLGKYEEAEQNINKAITSVSEGNDRERIVQDYQNYLLKVSIIKSYDLSDEKVRDLEKLKVNNYKIIALMTTLLGFLLGEIAIFSKVEDLFTLAMLMLAYFALLLILCGVVLFALSVTFKERKKRYYAVDFLIFIIGVIIFIITMVIIFSKNRGNL